jgi:hypothetical protein
MDRSDPRFFGKLFGVKPGLNFTLWLVNSRDLGCPHQVPGDLFFSEFSSFYLLSFIIYEARNFFISTVGNASPRGWERFRPPRPPPSFEISHRNICFAIHAWWGYMPAQGPRTCPRVGYTYHAGKTNS